VTIVESVRHCASGRKLVTGLLCLLGPVVACADMSRPPTASPLYEASVQTAPPPVSTATIDAEFMQLRRALIRQVPRAISSLPPDRMKNLLARTRAALSADQTPVAGPGLLVVVDRNPAAQLLVIILAHPDRNWQLVGGSRVSTGQAGRHGYFITPTGVFQHTDSILDYRAEGTFNENHVRGLGRKGMRVWDFGWVTAVKGWRTDGETGEIRLLLHATDPDLLERRLGRPASEGCIRISAAMNEFLDRYGVLDADYETAAAVDPSYNAVLRPDRTPTSLAGRILVIIDSSMPMS
jgi:hypothetical protein